jgi:hypothetical protein
MNIFKMTLFSLILQLRNFLVLEALVLYKIHVYYFINKFLTLCDEQNLG